MPYPSGNPTAKHLLLLVSTRKVPSHPSEQTSNQSLAALPPLPNDNKHHPYIVLYTYRMPSPLSGRIATVGRTQVHVERLQHLLLPIHRCTVGVKQLHKNLNEQDHNNSKLFSKLTSDLQRTSSVAILAKNEKHGHWGILVPMPDTLYAATYWLVPDSDTLSSLLLETMDTTSDACGETRSLAHGAPQGNTKRCAPSLAGQKRSRDEEEIMTDSTEGLHQNSDARLADYKYSELVRDLYTRGDSMLYHMRAFHGWVKATLIQELAVKIAKTETTRASRHQTSDDKITLRVLDLACGKGGDLGKWLSHPQGVARYVGVDVARGSLCEAVARVRKTRLSLPARCSFVCADLGSDVLGRPPAPRKPLQKLLTWSMEEEQIRHSQPATDKPKFCWAPGGGILPSDKLFNVVSIQFSIHYMMSSQARARRFFRTVSDLLEHEGQLLVTTIDARVVVEHLMNLGKELFFENDNETECKDKDDFVISLGGGACRLTFQRDTVQRIFTATNARNMFGLKYYFELVEGSDHQAGVGRAVDLHEYLAPLPMLEQLAAEVGLKLVYKQNFHEFYHSRKDPQEFAQAHRLLRKMHVLNRHKSISNEEWEISHLYCALKFQKDKDCEPRGI